jgi:hypothetical protein
VVVDSRFGQDCCYSCFVLSSYCCLMGGWGWLYLIVQNSSIVEQQKVEQSLPPHEDVGEPWVVEDPEKESKGSVVVRLHKVHRKVWCFH